MRQPRRPIRRLAYIGINVCGDFGFVGVVVVVVVAAAIVAGLILLLLLLLLSLKSSNGRLVMIPHINHDRFFVIVVAARGGASQILVKCPWWCQPNTGEMPVMVPAKYW